MLPDQASINGRSRSVLPTSKVSAGLSLLAATLLSADLKHVIASRSAASCLPRSGRRSPLCPQLRTCLHSLSLIACFGCTQPSADQTRHPTPENLLPGEAKVLIGRQHFADEALDAAYELLSTMRPISKIGLQDGAESEVIGFVQDIALGVNGSLYILDSRFNNVRVHEPNGTQVSVLGGPGRGPNEFLSPQAIDTDEAGRIFVADRYNVIKTFISSKSDSVIISRLSAAPEDMCFADEMLFVQAAPQQDDSTGIVRTFAMPRAEVGVTFGAPYLTDNWLVRNQLSDGPLVCAPGRVVVMLKYLPFVRAYRSDGTLAWVDQLDDFHPLTITSGVEEGRLFVQLEGDRYDIGHNMVAVTDSVILVQVAEYDRSVRAPREGPIKLRSYLMRTSDGNGYQLDFTLPDIADIRNDLIATYTNDPFPRVTLNEAGGN